jgi:hypothetical protein
MKCGALTGLRFRPDAAPVLKNDAMDGGETDAGPFVFILAM